MDDNSYEYLKRSILKLTNIDLDNYKSQQMRRRLSTLFEYSKFDNVAAYVAGLQEDSELLGKLHDFLTINVSEFFRDKAVFEIFQSAILPDLLRQRPVLNIWSAGCSRGEEPYSVAMLLNRLSPGQKHYILGTDIDEHSLIKARNGGPYSLNELKAVPPDFVSRYFYISGNEAMIKDNIKEMVKVKRHDLLNNRFEKGFDLIICRNVVIYFTEKTKRSLNERFFNSLSNGGILFIGGTEVMLEATAIGFKQISPFFYCKPDKSINEPVQVVAFPN